MAVDASCKKSACEPRWSVRPVLSLGFCGIMQLGIFLLPPGFDASPSQGYPACIKFATAHCP